MAILKKTITSVDNDVEQLEPSYRSEGNVNDAATLENSLVVPEKVKPKIDNFTE